MVPLENPEHTYLVEKMPLLGAKVKCSKVKDVQISSIHLEVFTCMIYLHYTLNKLIVNFGNPGPESC